MLKKLIRLEAADFKLLWIPAAAWLLVQLVTGGVMLFAKADTCPLISPILLPVICTLLSFLVTLGHGIMSFEQALRMGMTRRRALALSTALSLATATAFLALGAVLILLEQALGRWVWPILSPGVEIADFSQMIPWWGYALAYLGSLVIGFCAGAGIQRYGGKFAWLLWGVWMLCFLLPDKLQELSVSRAILIPVLALLATGALLWATGSYLRAVIKR